MLGFASFFEFSFYASVCKRVSVFSGVVEYFYENVGVLEVGSAFERVFGGRSFLVSFVYYNDEDLGWFGSVYDSSLEV